MAGRHPKRLANRRCLIVERHEWETGGAQQQLQFLLGLARAFFGSGDIDRRITVRVFLPADAPAPAFTREITISREYSNGTRRTNGFPEMRAIPASFGFFEETAEPDVYDLWWQVDRAIIGASFTGWSQGGNTQYGRGRLSIIEEAEGG